MQKWTWKDQTQDWEREREREKKNVLERTKGEKTKARGTETWNKRALCILCQCGVWKMTAFTLYTDDRHLLSEHELRRAPGGWKFGGNRSTERSHLMILNWTVHPQTSYSVSYSFVLLFVLPKAYRVTRQQAGLFSSRFFFNSHSSVCGCFCHQNHTWAKCSCGSARLALVYVVYPFICCCCCCSQLYKTMMQWNYFSSQNVIRNVRWPRSQSNV